MFWESNSAISQDLETPGIKDFQESGVVVGLNAAMKQSSPAAAVTDHKMCRMPWDTVFFQTKLSF